MQSISLTKPMTFIHWKKLRRLYLQAFPAAERKPMWMILKKYRKGVTDIWCIEQDDLFSGLAITINSKDVVLLDYFAVEKNCRGKGIGRAALQAIGKAYEGRGLFLEIESTLGQAENQAQREKRKHFYLSSGLQEFHTTAKLFGVDMELLGVGCHLDYAQYKAFYRDNYSAWAAEHIEEV